MSRGKNRSASEEYAERIKKVASKYDQQKQSARANSFKWSHAGAEDVLDVIAAVTEDGCAVTFGKTSDGGALLIAVLDNGHPAKWFASDMADLNEKLAEIKAIATGT